MKWKRPFNEKNFWFYIGMTYLIVMGVIGTIDLIHRIIAWW